jgi:hypothetical protein
LAQILRAARARAELAIRYGSHVQIDRAISLLATLPPADQTDEARLLLAFAIALHGVPLPSLIVKDSSNLRALDTIADQGGPFSPHALLLAAQLRALQAEAMLASALSRAAFHELLQQREQLGKHETACKDIAAAAAKLPAALRERVAEPVRDCAERFRFFKQTFDDLLRN